MTLKFTLGEKLTGERSNKPVGTTCEKFAGRQYREPCGCGRGFIEYEYDRHGYRFSLHTLYLDSKSFGRQDTAPCCEQCAKDQEAEWAREAQENGWDEYDY